jgi:nitroreductase
VSDGTRGERVGGPSLWEDGRPTPGELDVVNWVLTTTRANRKTLDLTRPVEPEVIEECLRVALQAPVAHNEQRWHWVVVSDEATRKAIAEVYVDAWEAVTKSDRRKVRRFASADQRADRTQDSAHWLGEHIHEIPMFVIPCQIGPKPDSDLALGAWRKTMRIGGMPQADDTPMLAAWWGSIFPAIWSFQLSLRARGLGSVVTVMHLADEQRVAKVLGLPPHASQVALLPVAYLTKTAFSPARRAPLETRLSWDTWLGSRA